MTQKIGFIGLGIMGKPMAKNLIAAGYELVVYNKSKPGMDELGAAGATVVGSSKEVGEAADVIITMLPDSADSELVILGENGVLACASKGNIVIDMSSIAPLVSQKIAAECEKKGVDMLDAPVSGGEPGAIEGTLSIMVGGKQGVFDCCLEIMQVMGAAVVLTGDIGAGNTTKLANQIIVAANIEALSEAFVLAQKAGVDPEKVFNAIKGGLAGSNVMNAKGPMMLDRNFNPGFRIRLHQKDLRNVLQTAQDLNVPLPVTALVQQILGTLVNEGHEELDHSGILKFVEGLSKIEVKKQG